MSSLVGLVSSKRRLQRPPNSVGDAEIQDDRLGVADVQIPVRLGRKSGVHAAAVAAGVQVLEDDFTDEILCAPRLGRQWLRTVHSLRRS